MDAVSSQKLTVKFNKLHIIKSSRDKSILRTNHQENISIFIHITHIHAIGKKPIILSINPPTPDHIDDVLKSHLGEKWHDSIYGNYKKMEKSTTFSAPSKLSLLPLYTKILYPRISFGVKTTEIDNHSDINSRICAYVSSVIEVVDFTFSYAPVTGIKSLRIINAIAHVEVMIIFILDIYNSL